MFVKLSFKVMDKQKKGEKMKKLLFCVMAGVVAMSCAHADDTDKIKAACERSEKTVWVERNKVCVPRNPCNSSDPDIVKYCNRTFADFESSGGTDAYIDLINIYAATHGLNCQAVEQKAKLVGQDYVLCQGTDVMVFEFDDINDYQPLHLNDWTERFVKALCTAGRGTLKGDTCQLSPESICIMSENLLQKNPDLKKFLISTSSGDLCEVTIDRQALKAARGAAEAIQDYNNNRL